MQQRCATTRNGGAYTDRLRTTNQLDAQQWCTPGSLRVNAQWRCARTHNSGAYRDSQVWGKSERVGKKMENGADGDSDILNIGTLYVWLSKR